MIVLCPKVSMNEDNTRSKYDDLLDKDYKAINLNSKAT